MHCSAPVTGLAEARNPRAQRAKGRPGAAWSGSPCHRKVCLHLWQPAHQLRVIWNTVAGGVCWA